MVYAHREDASNHSAYRQWLESIINGQASFGYSELALSVFLRIVTHHKVFEMPSTLSTALCFAEQIRTLHNAVCLTPGAMHWKIFKECLEQINATGNDIPDAYHVALAMEWGCEWVTTDKGFKRFKGLKVRHPLTLLNN